MPADGYPGLEYQPWAILFNSFGVEETDGEVREGVAGEVCDVIRRNSGRLLVTRWSASEVIQGGRFAARVGGQGAISVGSDGLDNEADTAVTEGEIASTRMEAAKAADHVFAAGAVADHIEAVDRGRGWPAIHRFIANIVEEAVLRRHREHRSIKRMGGIGHAGRAPRLIEQDRLAGEGIDGRARRNR